MQFSGPGMLKNQIPTSTITINQRYREDYGSQATNSKINSGLNTVMASSLELSAPLSSNLENILNKQYSKED